MQPKKTDTIPWYRQPLVWLVIFFPAATVVAGIATLIIAMKTDDGLVVDDYYKKGKEINRVLTRDREAASLGMKAVSVYKPDTKILHFSLASTTGAQLPETLHLQLMHTTRGGFDVDTMLQVTGSGAYQSALPAKLVRGVWTVQLSTDAWRISGRMKVPDQTTATLQAIVN
ncbi:MAG: hypothetical protein EP297_01125 [Gammaproteobacteria bacterium]|nr:MAG: hypothetical protein EP297_01125 [Gammaproteobacteria bacterium]